MQHIASCEVLTTINFETQRQNPFLWLAFKILRSRDKNQIFNLCFKKFLKIKIFEIQRKKWFWPLKSGKIYIEGENDIQNSNAKFEANDNHSHLVNVAHPW